MKYNVRDPRTGRFVKQIVSVKENKTMNLPKRDPITGRFIKKDSINNINEPETTTEDSTSEVPEWKTKYDEAMCKFNESMAEFNRCMDVLKSLQF